MKEAVFTVLMKLKMSLNLFVSVKHIHTSVKNCLNQCQNHVQILKICLIRQIENYGI